MSNSRPSLLSENSGLVVWFTGRPGAGKSTLARGVQTKLQSNGAACLMIDGDILRQGLCRDLGFSIADRAENVRRASEVAAIGACAGLVVLVAMISPIAVARDAAIGRLKASGIRTLEVYVNAPLDVCEARDPKLNYQRARAGQLPDFTGIQSPYEAPLSPDMEIKTGERDIEGCVKEIFETVFVLLR